MTHAAIRFSEAQRRAADAFMAEFAEQHAGEFIEDICRLHRTWEAAPPGEAAGACRLLAHDLSGLGDTFGFPLVTSLCRSLCRFLKLRGGALDGAREVIAVHMDALRLIAAERVRGDGGPIGREITEELARAVRKFDLEYAEG